MPVSKFVTFEFSEIDGLAEYGETLCITVADVEWEAVEAVCCVPLVTPSGALTDPYRHSCNSGGCRFHHDFGQRGGTLYSSHSISPCLHNLQFYILGCTTA